MTDVAPRASSRRHVTTKVISREESSAGRSAAGRRTSVSPTFSRGRPTLGCSLRSPIHDRGALKAVSHRGLGDMFQLFQDEPAAMRAEASRRSRQAPIRRTGSRSLEGMRWVTAGVTLHTGGPRSWPKGTAYPTGPWAGTVNSAGSSRALRTHRASRAEVMAGSRHHVVPASVIGSFSPDSSGPRRKRKIVVSRCAFASTKVVTADSVGWKQDLYSLSPSRWGRERG